MQQQRSCAMCGELIEPGEAWMTSESGRVAHSGCVYRDEAPDARMQWSPGEDEPSA